jgi:hypothetical protein
MDGSAASVSGEARVSADGAATDSDGSGLSVPAAQPVQSTSSTIMGIESKRIGEITLAEYVLVRLDKMQKTFA